MAYIFRLDQQRDASISSPVSGNLLMHNGTAWVNTALSGIGLKTLTISTGLSGASYNPGSADVTIAHATGDGYYHIPTGGAAGQYVKWQGTNAGQGVWASFAALTPINTTCGIKIGGSTSGSYDPLTAKTIEVDFAVVQAAITNNVTGTGVANQIAYWSSTSAITGSAQFTIDGSGNVTMGQNLTVTGNLTVNGTTTTINVNTLVVTDNMISLAKGNTAADSVDIGMYGTYYATTVKYGGLVRDASDGAWKFFKDLATEPASQGTITFASYATVWMDTAYLNTLPSGTSTNYVVWNSTTKAMEYRTISTVGSMSSFFVASTDVATGGLDIADGQYLCILGDGGVISSATANATTGHVKVTISHSAVSHIPSAGASNQYLQYASAGTAQWATFATLTTSAGKGLKIGGSTTGTYAPHTTAAIEVDFTQVQAYASNNVVGSGSVGQIATWTATAYTLTGAANFTYDGTTFKVLAGQIWKSSATVTASANFTAGEFIYNCTNTAAITLTFTTAFLTSNVGQSFYVKWSGTAAGSVTLATQGTETIDGSTSDYLLPGQYTAVLVHILSATAVIIL